MFFSAQDLRVSRPWEHWPAHLALPMILMRESMKKSMIQSITSSPPLKSPKSAAQRDKGEVGGVVYTCSVCGRIYKLKSSLRNHQKWECGKEPQFKCPYCVYKAKQKMHMARHMERMHKEIDYSVIKAEVEMKAEAAGEAEDNWRWAKMWFIKRHSTLLFLSILSFYFVNNGSAILIRRVMRWANLDI